MVQKALKNDYESDAAKKGGGQFKMLKFNDVIQVPWGGGKSAK